MLPSRYMPGLSKMPECLLGSAVLEDPLVAEEVDYHHLGAVGVGYRHSEAEGVGYRHLEGVGVGYRHLTAEGVGYRRYLEGVGVDYRRYLEGVGVDYRRYQMVEELVTQSGEPLDQVVVGDRGIMLRNRCLGRSLPEPRHPSRRAAPRAIGQRRRT